MLDLTGGSDSEPTHPSAAEDNTGFVGAALAELAAALGPDASIGAWVCAFELNEGERIALCTVQSSDPYWTLIGMLQRVLKKDMLVDADCDDPDCDDE